MGIPPGSAAERKPGLAVVVRLFPRRRQARRAEAFSLVVALTLALAAAVAIST